MPTGAITGYIDVAQLSLYAFWVFFAGLIYYLHREDKREGYPLDRDRSSRVTGRRAVPRRARARRRFLLPHGGTRPAPRGTRRRRTIRPSATAIWPGAPLQPTGDPMQDARRARPPTPSARTSPTSRSMASRMIVPLRVATELLRRGRRTPIRAAWTVIGADGRVGRHRARRVGRPRRAADPLPRGRRCAGTGAQAVLVPMNLAVVARRPRRRGHGAIVTGRAVRRRARAQEPRRR